MEEEKKSIKTYIVTFETKNTEIEKLLMSEIKKFPAWARLMKGVWLIKSEIRSPQIRDILKKISLDDDKIFVMRTSKGWAFKGLTVGDWIRKNI